jgi:hypothetical protein
MYMAKSNANRFGYFNMLTGNEDVSQIYAYIAQNQTKYVYKELIKFRKRTNYLEMVIYLMQKALSEDLSQEINEWAVETLDWIEKRNTSILGNNNLFLRKPDAAVITVGGNVEKDQAKGIEAEILNMQQAMLGQLAANNPQAILKRNQIKPKIKKYKLLIPLELDIIEKSKLEEKQKKAIDRLYDLLPELYDKWNRRQKLRKILQEESAQKAQLYVLIAMNNFNLLVNRIQASLPGLVHRINNMYYFDAQNFLFDKSFALIQVGLDGQQDSNRPYSSETDFHTDRAPRKEHSPVKSKQISKTSPSRSPPKIKPDIITEEKNNDYKDVSDLIAGVICGLDSLKENKKTKNVPEFSTEQAKKVNPLSPSDFSEVIRNIFDKFRYSVVLSHRGKQWTQLQNTCKLMFNCINSMLTYLPGMLFNNRKAFTLKDLWLSLHQCLYIAVENLLDMLLQTCPMEKINLKEMQHKINKWYDSANVGKMGANLKFDVPMDDLSSIDLRFMKDFVFRTVQCLAECEKWEKMCSIGMKFNALTR